MTWRSTSLRIALGSASTPFGIKAMQELAKKESKESLWDMETLVLINVCGFTLMPSSLLALRMNYGGEDNELVIFYCILIYFINFKSSFSCCKLFC